MTESFRLKGIATDANVTRKSRIACDRSYFSDKIKKKKTRIAANIIINANANDQLDLILRKEQYEAHKNEAEDERYNK